MRTLNQINESEEQFHKLREMVSSVLQNKDAALIDTLFESYNYLTYQTCYDPNRFLDESENSDIVFIWNLMFDVIFVNQDEMVENIEPVGYDRKISEQTANLALQRMHDALGPDFTYVVEQFMALWIDTYDYSPEDIIDMFGSEELSRAVERVMLVRDILI